MLAISVSYWPKNNFYKFYDEPKISFTFDWTTLEMFNKSTLPSHRIKFPLKFKQNFASILKFTRSINIIQRLLIRRNVFKMSLYQVLNPTCLARLTFRKIFKCVQDFLRWVGCENTNNGVLGVDIHFHLWRHRIET